jgi:syntaxin 1B/2/3
MSGCLCGTGRRRTLILPSPRRSRHTTRDVPRQERQEEALAIAQDAAELHGIVKELGSHVQEQGEALDQVEANVDTSHASVVQGNRELRKAAEYQSSYRKKVCVAIIGVLIIVAAITVPLVLKYVPGAHL